jgi:hypothetical protein
LNGFGHLEVKIFDLGLTDIMAQPTL